jgi:S1-C subfamily serine protease
MFGAVQRWRWRAVGPAAAALTAAAATAAAFLLGGAGGAHAARSVPIAKVSDGVVDVNTQLAYQNGAAAGTGIVVSPSGEVLTNNHVIRGATTIRVRNVANGRTYTATVAGYSVPADVALLKLKGAAGLTTARTGNSATVKVGQRVSAVGNAGGVGGSPRVSTGRVTALRQTITVGDGRGRTARLTGLIKTSVPLQPGDSGGPLLDSAGRVIGINAAASSGFQFRTGGGVGFAIPVNQAMAIAKQIRAGRSSDTVHIGPTAFLGVNVGQTDDFQGSPSTVGALVVGVVPGSPAARAGLVPGDVITSFDGHRVSSPTELVSLLLHATPNREARIGWVDQGGTQHTAAVRPAAGPPQ